MFSKATFNISGLPLLLVVNLLPLTPWQITVNSNDLDQAQKTIGYIGVSRRLDSDNLITHGHSSSTNNDSGHTIIYDDSEINGRGGSLYQLPSDSHEDGETDNGAGSRGECDRPDTFASLPQLTFLAPDSPTVGTTTQSTPTLLVYTPFDLTEDSPGKFIVEDMQGREIYSQVIRSQTGNSILAVSMPSGDEVSLDAGQNYRLNFRVYCNDPTMSNSTSLRARPQQIQRTEPNTSGEHWYDVIANIYASGMVLQLETLLETQEGLRNIPEALRSDE